MRVARLIIKSHYLRNSKGASNYLSYIATREGVVKISESQKDKPASSDQKQLIEELVKANKKIEKWGIYKDYLDNKTMGKASNLISTIENTFDESSIRGMEGYANYIATRKGVFKKGSNGLFSDGEGIISLSSVRNKLQNYDGIVFTPIVSLLRNDADNLGFNNPDSWRFLIKSHRNALASAYKIDTNNFEWYGAYHDDPNHPHIHLIFFSKDGSQGWQSKKTWEIFKSKLASDIFKNDKYISQIKHDLTATRNEIRQLSKEKMLDILDRLNNKVDVSDNVCDLLGRLSVKLKNTSGKHSYQYLKKPLKVLVDNIMNELGKDKDIAELLATWSDYKGGLVELYNDHGFSYNRFSDLDEFRPVKNAIIQAADELDYDTAKSLIINKNENSGVYNSLFMNIKAAFYDLLNIGRINHMNGKSSAGKSLAEVNKKQQKDKQERDQALGIKG